MRDFTAKKYRLMHSEWSKPRLWLEDGVWRCGGRYKMGRGETPEAAYSAWREKAHR